MNARFALAAVAMLVGTPSAGAQSCRVPSDAPPGVRVPLPPGCKPAGSDWLDAKNKPRPLKARTRPGFVDLGNGTEVRIDGRVRGESVLHR